MATRSVGVGLRVPLYQDQERSRFDGCPLAALDRISSISGHQYWADDFLQYHGPNTAGEAGGWTLTETAAGLGNTNRVDIDDSAQFGVLKLNTDDGDNDAEILQLTGEPWRYVVGKELGFFIRVATSDADDGEAFWGLAITDTSPIASLPTDGLFFEKAETATKMDFHARKNATSTERTAIDTAVMADGIFHEYGFLVDRIGNVHIWYDGTEVSTAVPAGNANLPNDEDLALILAFQTGAVAAKFMSVDWIILWQER